MIFSFFKKDPTADRANTLYAQIAEQARLPYFFEKWAAPDTVEGRFEILTVHMHLALRRLKRDDKNLSQAVFDVFFKSMDDAMREMGVGDMAIGRKIRGLAEAFYGRVGVYEEALEGADQEKLADAITRNVFEAETHVSAGDIAQYVMACEDAISAQSLSDIIASGFAFTDPAAVQRLPAEEPAE